jgi:cytochrome c oxidase cbb3-type subunit 3
MSPLTSVLIAVVSIVNVLACGWLIWWTARSRPDEPGQGELIDHVWDGDLQERNHPMPRWWLILFYVTIAFCFVYFLLYPALGSFAGTLGWSQAGQYEREMAGAHEKYAPVYVAFAGRDVASLATDPDARALGYSLFANNCTTCHGSDGRGAPGFPNLADGDWLYGGDPEAIVQSIANGRQGVMPPLGAALGVAGDDGEDDEEEDGEDDGHGRRGDAVDDVVAYVLSLSGREAPAGDAAAGQTRFAVCIACHGPDGRGNPALGAPNLTDDVWLYGGSPEAIRRTIVAGRNGQMPAHGEWLDADQIRLLAAYVYSLSRTGP